MLICTGCNHEINQDLTGEPYLTFREVIFCFHCYIDIIPEIYGMSGAGDGGIIHLHFKFLLQSSVNRKQRKPIPEYKKILKQLLPKYRFECLYCRSKENLTIDHIKPVSRGGTDDIKNLQILCKSCNSRKGNKYPYNHKDNGEIPSAQNELLDG